MGSYTRRDFLIITSAVAGAAALTALGWPVIAQFLPGGDDTGSEVEVNVSDMAQGMAITVNWRNKPVLIAHRTREQMALVRRIKIADLIDKYARNANLPQDSLAIDAARSGGKGYEEWLVVVNICTHLGCPPKFPAGPYRGFFCPCHGSIYDAAGRVMRGPAGKNLYIPPYHFRQDGILCIGKTAA